MIEVQRTFPEAPHIRSSRPHQQTDCRKKDNYCSSMNNTMSKVYQNVILPNRLAFRRFSPRHSETFRLIAKNICYLHRRTRHCLCREQGRQWNAIWYWMIREWNTHVCRGSRMCACIHVCFHIKPLLLPFDIQDNQSTYMSIIKNRERYGHKISTQVLFVQ